MRPIHASINLAALRHNYGVARRHARQTCVGARLWAVVKANAYGHGLERCVAALADEADGFALTELDRAVALRQAGLEKPLLILEGFYDRSELPDFLQHRLIPVLHCVEQLEILQDVSWPTDLPIYLKLDTGMHRLGFDAAELRAAYQALQQQGAQIRLMTHFADADGERGVDWQLQRWHDMLASLPQSSQPESLSLANSAALLRHPQAPTDWARPGIMLYGGSPFPSRHSADELDLRAVMTLRSQIISVRQLAAGESVGYGCSYTASEPMRVAVVACGYADGYPRHAASGTPIMVAGQRTQTLGRVSMDKLCVDLRPLPKQIGCGAPVTLWGEGLAADEIAMAAGTISYELFCRLAERVPVSLSE